MQSAWLIQMTAIPSDGPPVRVGCVCLKERYCTVTDADAMEFDNFQDERHG